MKALSFRQPWAELVLQGRKTMDLRTYSTRYRGRIAVHASQTVEADECWANELNPDNLETGGVVGTVEVVDVIPLDEAAYNAHRDAHLGGRRYREGLYGWILAHPERLSKIIPARGRTRLFNIDLEPSATSEESASSDAGSVEESASEDAGSPVTQSPIPDGTSTDNISDNPQSPTKTPTYKLNGATPEKPFVLHVQTLEGSSTDYALTLRQRVVERPEADPRLESIVTIGGDNLRAVADHVIEALRKADYKATDLSPSRRRPFYLPEEIGVRLGLVFLTVKPLSKFRRVEQISHGIRQMPSEEAYYWYSKCTAADTAERAQKALRVLLAAE